MRLFEVFGSGRSPFQSVTENSNQLVVKATDRFETDFSDFTKKYTAFTEKFRDFLKFRRTARPDQPYNIKDAPLAHNLRLFRRCHIIHGKGIVIYQIASGEVRLAAIVEHNAVEGAQEGRQLGSYLQSLRETDYHNFSLRRATETDRSEKAGDAQDTKPLTASETDEILKLFMMLAQHEEDRSVLDKARLHDFDELLHWARAALNIDDNSRDKAIMLALGGAGLVAKRARLYLEKTAHLVTKPVKAEPEPESTPAPEPVKAEPVKAEPVKAKPTIKAAPAPEPKVEPTPVEPVNADPAASSAASPPKPKRARKIVVSPEPEQGDFFAKAVADITGKDIQKRPPGRKPVISPKQQDRISAKSQREIDAMFKRWEKAGWRDPGER